MPLKRFLSVLNESMPTDESSIDLNTYHLLPILKKMIRSEKDRTLIENFLSNFGINTEISFN